MQRLAFFLYGVGCHLFFLAIYVWMGAFVGNVLVPRSIDAPSGGPVPQAIAIDLLLIAAFGLQHSVMARPAFKRVWTRIIPKPIERSTYVLASCLVTILLMWQWRPIDVTIWDVHNEIARAGLTALFAIGFLAVPAVSLMINHFDLFGTRQVWLHLKGKEYTPLPFRTPLAYGRVRHPLYVGWALFFWATPTMTAGHLLFAVTLTAYMVIASVIEERDLVAYFGPEYEAYQQRVPRFVPRLATSRASVAVTEST